MDAFDYLQLVSILLEAVIVVLCVRIALTGRPFVLGLALAFAIYVFYDLDRLLAWNAPEAVLRISFFIATAGAFYTVWRLLRSGPNIR
jgi:hypothetical protein